MGIRIDGKAIAAAVRADVKSEVQALKEPGIFPGMAVVIVGDDPASRIYVNNKKKACAEVGIYSEEFALPASTTQEELIRLVHELNARKDIHGILVQSPLPVGLDETAQAFFDKIVVLNGCIDDDRRFAETLFTT